ncbi:helix-turn-helix domain-containing protein [Streptomyces sp. NBC_01351]|uniref:helix-turn-helix domain-containing protein n=1 Tax=Streptomyces sp. NBC_01351 TaxID=2903833 RepID=UPI002E352063|nr:helix-turn-helix transcriptional regulator [Streptomyces sp. NBC_01351]
MEERRELFGGLLRGARERVGLTQEVLAERSGLSARAIGNLERGRAKPRADSLRRIVQALGGAQRDGAALVAAAGLPVPAAVAEIQQVEPVEEPAGPRRLNDTEALVLFELLGGVDTESWDPDVRATLLRACSGSPAAVRLAGVVLATVPELPLEDLARRLDGLQPA